MSDYYRPSTRHAAHQSHGQSPGGGAKRFVVRFKRDRPLGRIERLTQTTPERCPACRVRSALWCRGTGRAFVTKFLAVQDVHNYKQNEQDDALLILAFGN
jgi:hypothetical protein